MFWGLGGDLKGMDRAMGRIMALVVGRFWNTAQTTSDMVPVGHSHW